MRGARGRTEAWILTQASLGSQPGLFPLFQASWTGYHAFPPTCFCELTVNEIVSTNSLLPRSVHFVVTALNSLSSWCF